MKSLLVAMALASSTDGRQLRSLASMTEEAVAEVAVIESGFSVYDDPSSAASASTNEHHHANIFASTGAKEDDAAAAADVETEVETTIAPMKPGTTTRVTKLPPMPKPGTTTAATTTTTTTTPTTTTPDSKAAKGAKGAKDDKTRKVDPPPMMDFCPEQAMSTQQARGFSTHAKRPVQTAWKNRKNQSNSIKNNKTKRDTHKMGYEESAKKQRQKSRSLKGGRGGRGAGKKKNVKDVPLSPPSSTILEEILDNDLAVKPLIVGGRGVDPPRKYPFYAYYGGCGGSLIAPNLILSAAHCEIVAVDGIVTLGFHVTDVDKDSQDEFTNIEQIPVKNVVVHPCYDEFSDDNDFMIIELEYATTMYLDNIVELDTPDDDGVDLVDGLSLTVMGNGNLFSADFFVPPDVLQEVDVGVDSTCGEYFPSDITQNMFCAGMEGLDACQGDSGGPIIDAATQKQVGVVSWGLGCGMEGFPGVYARVSAAMDWIKYVMSEKAGENAAPGPASAEDTISGWYDSFVDGCLWYANNIEFCQTAEMFANGGLSANQVCPACAAVNHVSEINGSIENGSAKFGVDFLYDGKYEAAVHGLVAAQIIPGTVTIGAQTASHQLEISDMAAFRVVLITSVDIDLDLAVNDPNGVEVALSENSFTNEVIDIIAPMNGTWTVSVVAFDIDNAGNRYEGDYDLYIWKIPTTPSDDARFIINAAPETATRGGSGEVEFSYPTVLSEDEWFLGAISHTGKGIFQSLTFLTFDSNVEFGKLIDTADFLLQFEVDPIGEGFFNATFGYTGNYAADALPLVAATLNTGSLDRLSKFASFEFELHDIAYFQAQLPFWLHNFTSDDDLDMIVLDPNSQIVGESLNSFIDEFVELVFPENGIYLVYIYGAFFENPVVEYSMLSWKLPMESSDTNLVVKSSPKSAVEGNTEDIEISWNGVTSGSGPEHYVIGAVSHTGMDDIKVLTTVEIDNWVIE